MHREITWRVAVLSLGQALLFIVVLSAAILFQMDWRIVAGILLLAASAIWGTITGEKSAGGLALAWTATVFVWVLLSKDLGNPSKIEVLDLIGSPLIVGALFLTSERVQAGKAAGQWRGVALAWGMAATANWLASTYIESNFYGFHLAIGGCVLVLIGSRLLLRLPGAAILAVHTLILLLVALPVTDLLLRPSYRLNPQVESGKDYYSFEAAKKDPAAFRVWWTHFMNQWSELHKEIAIRDSRFGARYRMKPNSEGKIFQSTIHINSLGFRGPEIDVEKGKAYRIMALGESTTFGCTITKEDKPWPRILERLLRDQLHIKRPIEVINAGVYGLTIRENVLRLQRRLLKFKPDMIISYHGYNFFGALDPAIPPPRGKAPPAYCPRPLKLLADFEYQVKLRYFLWSRVPRLNLEQPLKKDPMKTAYGRAYEKLIGIARTNHIRLVLANYSMAVNRRSDPAVLEFYRAAFPEIRRSIQANRLHTELVARLAKENPEVCYIDTHPALDGQHEEFIDLVHFTQEGRRDLAETFYEGIKEIVQVDATRVPSKKDENG